MEDLALSPTTYATKVKESKANICPNCNSTDIEGGFCEIQAQEAVQTVSCLVCDSSWTDVYQLTGYVNPQGFSRKIAKDGFSVKIWHDDCSEHANPFCEDNDNPYTFIPFHRKYRNAEDPDNYFLNWNRHGSPDFRKKKHERMYAEGSLHILSYFEHGACIWSLKGTGPQCRFDNVPAAGLLVFDEEYAKDKDSDKLHEIAGSLMEDYTAYVNGYVYGYCIWLNEEDPVDGCAGFLGTEEGKKYMLEQIVADLTAREVDEYDIEIAIDAQVFDEEELREAYGR